jgi:hypothetical protein
MERVFNLDLFGAHSSGGYLCASASTYAVQSNVINILEVVGREDHTMVYYDLEKGEYRWDSMSEKSILDVLSKQPSRDWWCGYPVYIHSDYRAVLARRLNLIIARRWEERGADANFSFFLRSGLEAWKEQLGCVWDEVKKQFIV